MKESIPGKGPHSQGNQELEQVVIEDLLHDGNDCHTQESHQTDDHNGNEAVPPYCIHTQINKVNLAVLLIYTFNFLYRKWQVHVIQLKKTF